MDHLAGDVGDGCGVALDKGVETLAKLGKDRLLLPLAAPHMPSFSLNSKTINFTTEISLY